MASSTLKIISANIRGLRQVVKRRDLMDYVMSQNPDILCLQETHLVQGDLDTLIKEWNVNYYIAGTSTNSRGVCIIINKTFEFKVSNIHKDKEGRYIILDLDIANLFTLTIANIYAPNTDDSVRYNNFLKELINVRSTSLIVVGDWNTPLTEMDTYNYNVIRHPKCRETINNFILKESMVDIWRLSNKNMKGFTWRSQKPCRRSRLDYFLLSDDLLSLDPKVEYLPAYKSDHNPICLTFIKSRQIRGKGL